MHRVHHIVALVQLGIRKDALAGTALLSRVARAAMAPCRLPVPLPVERKNGDPCGRQLKALACLVIHKEKLPVVRQGGVLLRDADGIPLGREGGRPIGGLGTGTAQKEGAVALPAIVGKVGGEQLGLVGIAERLTAGKAEEARKAEPRRWGGKAAEINGKGRGKETVQHRLGGVACVGGGQGACRHKSGLLLAPQAQGLGKAGAQVALRKQEEGGLLPEIGEEGLPLGIDLTKIFVGKGQLLPRRYHRTLGLKGGADIPVRHARQALVDLGKDAAAPLGVRYHLTCRKDGG